MGIKENWQADVLQTMQQEFNCSMHIQKDDFTIINCNPLVAIHLMSLNNTFLPENLINLQSEFQQKGIQLVHLWEDVWFAKKTQVLSRVRSFLGLNKSIHARKAKIIIPSNKDVIQFFDCNHLQGFVKAKYSFALVNEYGEFLAVASFSEARPMKFKAENYWSAELVRFASINGFTIVGGFSKLLQHFLKQIKVNDVMTYADRDWSLGKGYEQLNFELDAITEPAFLYVQLDTLTRYFPHRLPKPILTEFKAQNALNLDDFLSAKGFKKVFNTGNLKYLLHL